MGDMFMWPRYPCKDTAAEEASMPRGIGSPFVVRVIRVASIISFLGEVRERESYGSLSRGGSRLRRQDGRDLNALIRRSIGTRTH